MNIKEKLQSSFGAIGSILYFIVILFVSILPIIMINTSFWLDILFFFLMDILPVSSIVFWVWGLVKTIQGPQDWLAIVYYISFAVLFLPFIITTIVGFFSKD